MNKALSLSLAFFAVLSINQGPGRAQSVALEQVEACDGVSPAGGTLRLRYAGVAPWTVMLIELRAD